MANAKEQANKSAKKASSRAEKLLNSVSERVKNAVEQGNEYASDAAQFNKANVEAVVEAAKVAAEGAQEIGKDNVTVVRKNLEIASTDVKELFAVRSPREFLKLQTEMTRKGLDRFVDQATKNANATTKLAGKAYQPIANRLTTISKEIKKAA